MSDKNILLGNKTKNGGPYHIFPKTRSTHMHVIGATGVGKSKFLEHLIREDILANNGLCLIDPHGYLYNDIVRWLETVELFNHREIILFDPSEENLAFGFNPLKVDSTEISYHVDKMVEAVSQVWGGEDRDKTPRLGSTA